MRAEWLLILLGLTTVTCEYTPVDLVLYDDYEIPDMRFLCFNYNITANVSEKCAKQLNIVCGNLTLLMTMLDASSKFPYPGLGFASRSDYGNYDQCMTVAYEYDGGKILGEHCAAGLLIPDLMGNASDLSTAYKLSVCRPNACSASDFNNIAQHFIPSFPPLFQDLMCSTVETDTDITAEDIVTITIFAICTLLMIISTTYDFYIYKMEIKCHHPLFLAFSVLSNGRKLLQVSPRTSSKEQILCFNGLKAISIMWIAAGHGFSGWKSVAVVNADKADNWIKQRYAGYIATGPLAVDTFFFISGFLLTFHYLKQKAKPVKEQIFSIPHIYLHRYLRITPAMLMIYLVAISFFRHLGSGPVWNYAAENLVHTCKDNWWSFFLYIQNYYNHDNICMDQTWYLSADMQMFLMAPLFLIPLSLNLRKSTGFTISMVELLIVNLFCIALPITLNLIFRDYVNYFTTHERLNNYFIGMMFAVFMRVKIDKPFLYGVNEQYKSIVNLTVWIIILLGMLVTIICYQEVQMNHGYESNVAFFGLMRTAWCTGLSWIVYSCYHGHGGIVNDILSNGFMQVLAKLTYCLYLVHMLVIVYFLAISRYRQYFHDYIIFYDWCGHFIVSLVISVYWTLAFESPLIIIEKYVFGNPKKPSK